jgi:GT2 family glycosyltransferase
MFFHNSVFERVGLFNTDMGSGTPFACEDIEMASRASMAGFAGVQIPELVVRHHHGRSLGSTEAREISEGYDYGEEPTMRVFFIEE